MQEGKGGVRLLPAHGQPGALLCKEGAAKNPQCTVHIIHYTLHIKKKYHTLQTAPATNSASGAACDACSWHSYGRGCLGAEAAHLVEEPRGPGHGGLSDDVQLAPEEGLEVVGVDPLEGLVELVHLRVGLVVHVVAAGAPQDLDVQLLLGLRVPSCQAQALEQRGR